jgi:SAM-dependent methyltransferase
MDCQRVWTHVDTPEPWMLRTGMGRNRFPYGVRPREVALREDYLAILPEDMPQIPPSPWYETWFDNPHYHRLYGHRNGSEATTFIKNLHRHFGWAELHLLDLACGQGRHAEAAATLGHDVVGMDLSANSIDHARRSHSGRSGLSFVEGNMLDFDLGCRFDGVLNLFTSFGYFDRREDHLAVLHGIHRHLKAGGFLVLDYLNADFSRSRLVPEETVKREGVEYMITRSFGDLGHGVNGFIKTIEFEQEGRTHRYTEKVSGMGKQELTGLLEQSGLKVFETFGDYDLATWTPVDSPRLILYAQAS